ncbi:MAG: hypothetical protein KJ649_06760, partial [Proteobacteria bacterium]|nr:hypothetical protein [Pseudomonadota bacterium]
MQQGFPAGSFTGQKAGRKRRRESVGCFKNQVFQKDDPHARGDRNQQHSGGIKMKKFLVVLLSLGLIVAFGATASA